MTWFGERLVEHSLESRSLRRPGEREVASLRRVTPQVEQRARPTVVMDDPFPAGEQHAVLVGQSLNGEQERSFLSTIVELEQVVAPLKAAVAGQPEGTIEGRQRVEQVVDPIGHVETSNSACR